MGIKGRKPSPALAVAIAALVVALGGTALATIPGPDEVIHGCYKKRSGKLRLVEEAGGTACRRNAAAISWSQQGPVGPEGPRGMRGDPGPKGDPGTSSGFYDHQSNTSLGWNQPGVATQTVVASLSLPAGTYSVTGSAWIDNQATDVIAGCGLALVDSPSENGDQGVRFGNIAQVSINNAGHGAAQDTLVNIGLITLDNPGIVRQTCAVNPWTATPSTAALAKANTSYLSAVEISDATQQ